MGLLPGVIVPVWSLPGRFRFGHNSYYSRYLHETGTNIRQIGLKSSRLLDRADYFQTGMKSERYECKLK